jgi:hypothetical protein
MRGHFIFVPIDVATKPAEGHAYADRWWSVHPNLGVAFYVAPNTERGQGYEPSPQCNADERVARHLTARLLPACETRHLPVVFAAHALRAMRTP